MSTTQKSKSKSTSAAHKTLFIVESPNKVKTIEKYLGDNFIVRATVGHIADIPEKKGSIDIANNFTPHYVLTERGTEVISDFQKDLKQCNEVVLATDDDREGELIAAHVLEFLAPQVPVKRIVFHAVTKAAIEEALENPRPIDENIVEAARTRRILDRLFGFDVSGITIQKVRKNTSAGRVQSPALRLVVEREYERMAFVPALYADVAATSDTTPVFTASLKQVDGKAIATGRDFNAAGELTKDVTVLAVDSAQHIVDALESGAISLVVANISSKEATQNPKPPFTMSSLYIDALNRLGMSVGEARTVSQFLFEKGLITYPRTDNPVHDAGSRHAIRSAIAEQFGPESVAPFHRYTSSKKKNMQGAHEAIRPTFMDNTSPKGLPDRQLAMYKMIWQRTMASQMTEAKGTTVTVTMRTDGGDVDAVFSASGTTYTQQGFRAVYAPVTEDDDSGAPFPELAIGDVVPVASAEVREHATTPPPRFNEGSLVKELENLGIGRPSTYAEIIRKLRDKYVWSKGGDKAFIPTITAFAVHRLLTQNFAELLDYGFTNELEETLDRISTDKSLRDEFLKEFYFGNEDIEGLQTLVARAAAEVNGKDMYALHLGQHPDTGEDIIVRAGKMFGKTASPYIECGGVKQGVPDETEFAGLSISEILGLLAIPKLLGHVGDTPLYIRKRGNSSFFQLGDKDHLPEGSPKPVFASLLSSMNPHTVTMEDAIRMFSLPRVVGTSEAGDTITATVGKHGAYISCAGETRSMKDDERVFTITEEEARELLHTPKKPARGGKRGKK